MAKLLVKNGEAILVDGEVLLATEAEPELQTKSVSYTPTESQQTATVTPDTGYDGLDEVDITVGAIASDYVASGITRRSSSDLTVSGGTVTAPAGYYQASASKSVAAMTLPKDPSTTSSGTSKATIDRSASTRYLNIPTGYNSTAQYYTISAVPNGSATTPATTITANPGISVNASGLITATASASQSVTPTVSAGYVSSGTAGTIAVSGSNTSQLSTQAGTTITPTESQQTAVAAGKYTTGAVNVAAISSTYVGSGIDRNDSTDLNVVGATVQVPNGYYEENASATVASGSAGTPTATKGTVSNHSVSVTPSVTNTTGYITGGTKTGTAVSVSASELVSGSKSITSNGTGIDVTNYATVDVNVAGGGGGAIAIIDTPDSHGGTVREIVAVDISNDTVTAAHLEQGYTAHDAEGNPISGTLIPGGDSAFVVTVSWNSTSELWEPDCTIYELQDAYDDGAEILCVGENGETAYCFYDDDYSFVYGVYDPAIASGFLLREYLFTTSGVSHASDNPLIFPNFDSPTRSYTPTESQQTDTITYNPNDGYNGIAQVGVTIGAISPTYVGSGITRRSSTDLTASGATVTVPAGYYESQASKAVATMTLPSAPTSSSSGTSKGTISRSTSTRYLNIPTGYNSTAQYYTIEAVANGTAGTPTATKGTVSNHSISVTPSVTNTTGYITGGTKTGTAVTVSASELVSGSETKTANGTYDVTNLAQLVVSVSGSGKAAQIASGVGRVASQTYVSSNISLTVGKTGKYSVYWNGYRSSTSGTSGSQLYIGTTAYGSANTTFNGTYTNVQNVHLSGVSLTANQTITVYARSRSGSYYMYIMNLVIIEE